MFSQVTSFLPFLRLLYTFFSTSFLLFSPLLPSYLFSIIRSYLFSPFFGPTVLPFLPLLLSFRPTFSPPPSFQPFITFPSFLHFLSFLFPSFLPLQTSNYLYLTLQASYQCRIYSVLETWSFNQKKMFS